MRTRDLLRGGTGHSAKDIRTFRGGEQFVRAFLALPVPFPPGTHFVYNPPASLMVSLIVEKVAGESLSDCLRPRLFQPLNIQGPVFESGAASYPAAARTEELAKLGLLYVQRESGKANKSFRRHGSIPLLLHRSQQRIGRTEVRVLSGCRDTAISSGDAVTTFTVATARSGNTAS